VLIGAPRWSGCGSVFEFTRTGQSWRGNVQLADPGCGAGDRFGYSVALSGTTAVIGAPGTKGASGQVYGQAIP